MPIFLCRYFPICSFSSLSLSCHLTALCPFLPRLPSELQLRSAEARLTEELSEAESLRRQLEAASSQGRGADLLWVQRVADLEQALAVARQQASVCARMPRVCATEHRGPEGAWSSNVTVYPYPRDGGEYLCPTARVLRDAACTKLGE